MVREWIELFLITSSLYNSFPILVICIVSTSWFSYYQDEYLQSILFIYSTLRKLHSHISWLHLMAIVSVSWISLFIVWMSHTRLQNLFLLPYGCPIFVNKCSCYGESFSENICINNSTVIINYIKLAYVVSYDTKICFHESKEFSPMRKHVHMQSREIMKYRLSKTTSSAPTVHVLIRRRWKFWYEL